MREKEDIFSYRDINYDAPRTIKKHLAALVGRMRFLRDKISSFATPHPADFRVEEHRALAWALSAAVGNSAADRLVRMRDAALPLREPQVDHDLF